MPLTVNIQVQLCGIALVILPSVNAAGSIVQRNRKHEEGLAVAVGFPRVLLSFLPT